MSYASKSLPNKTQTKNKTNKKKNQTKNHTCSVEVIKSSIKDFSHNKTYLFWYTPFRRDVRFRNPLIKEIKEFFFYKPTSIWVKYNVKRRMRYHRCKF